MKSIAILYLFMLLAFATFASIKPAIHLDKLLLKLSLHELADPFGGSVQMGIEYRPFSKLGIQIELGRNFYHPYFWGAQPSIISYTKYRSRVAYYFYRKEKAYMYTGFDFLFIDKSHISEGERVLLKEGYFRFDKAKVDKYVFGLFGYWGIIFKVWGNIKLDFSLNAGVRQSRVAYSNFVNLQQAQKPKDRVLTSYPYDDEGVHYFPHIGLGLRLCYSLFSKKI